MIKQEIKKGKRKSLLKKPEQQKKLKVKKK